MAKDKATSRKKKTVDKKPENQKTYDKSFAFDMAKFQSTQYERRYGEVSVPDLKDFYPEGVVPMIKCQNLTSEELARVDSEVALNREARKEFLDGSHSEEIVNALKTVLHIVGTTKGDDVPDAYVKMLNFVSYGIVKPKMDFEMVKKFAKVYPVEFRQVFGKINLLTGLGMVAMGKPKKSGATQKSK